MTLEAKFVEESREDQMVLLPVRTIITEDQITVTVGSFTVLRLTMGHGLARMSGCQSGPSLGSVNKGIGMPVDEKGRVLLLDE